MNHEVICLEKVVLLRVRDELGSQNAGPFREAVEKVADRGSERIIVDLSGITFMSSMAISALFALYRKLQDGGGGLALVGVGRELGKIFDLVGIPSLVRIFDRQADAVEFLQDEVA